MKMTWNMTSVTHTARSEVPSVGDVRIRELFSKRRDIDRFLRMPYAIYQDDPYWVAPLLCDARKVFDRSNPFFQHAEMQLWVAESKGVDVGRIAAIIDHSYNALHQEKTAFFGSHNMNAV